MASVNLYPQFETNLMSNRKVIKLLSQLKSAKAHGKNYIKVKLHLVRHLQCNRLLTVMTKLTLNMTFVLVVFPQRRDRCLISRYSHFSIINSLC